MESRPITVIPHSFAISSWLKVSSVPVALHKGCLLTQLALPSALKDANSDPLLKARSDKGASAELQSLIKESQNWTKTKGFQSSVPSQ